MSELINADFNLADLSSNMTSVGVKPRPVLQSLEAELSKYTGYMKRRAQPGYKPQPQEPASRPYASFLAHFAPTSAPFSVAFPFLESSRAFDCLPRPHLKYSTPLSTSKLREVFLCE